MKTLFLNNFVLKIIFWSNYSDQLLIRSSLVGNDSATTKGSWARVMTRAVENTIDPPLKKTSRLKQFRIFFSNSNFFKNLQKWVKISKVVFSPKKP
jgi:hypothetical protein